MNAKCPNTYNNQPSGTYIKALQNIFTTQCNICKESIHSTSTYSELYNNVENKTKEEHTTTEQNYHIVIILHAASECLIFLVPICPNAKIET